MKTDSKTLAEILKLHAQYVKEVEFSGIKPLSMEIYKTNSHNFVRWIQDEFHPGRKLRKEALSWLTKALIKLNVFGFWAAGEWEHRQLFFYSTFFVKFG